MREPLLVINAGSSSIKFSAFDTTPGHTPSATLHGQIEGIGGALHLSVTDAAGHPLADRPVGNDEQHSTHATAIAAMHDWFWTRAGGKTDFIGVGHRIVHGGSAYSQPILIDGQVLSALDALIPLAPLHQPHQLAAIRAIRKTAPQLPQVACFDTAFHSSQPWAARTFALPRALTAKGIRRYGFHGLSYEYILSVLPRYLPDCARDRIVVAHLGNGASMCAIANGRSVASTMGLTALDGLPMGTRAGALDPGVILYLLQHERMAVADIETLLYQHSGLLGVSGISSDVRILLKSDAPAAKEALDLFVYRIGRELGSLTAAMGGLDALIFTGGIGEHAASIRARVCHDARWLGILLDEEANAQNGPCISAPESAASAWVIPTDENLMIARHTLQLLDR